LMRHQNAISTGLLIASIVIGVSMIVLSPSRLYRLFGGYHQFARAVRLSVPKDATLSQLEAAVGPGTPVGGEPSWMQAVARQSPQNFPDGFQANDSYVRHTFPEMVFYFQIRRGRLVNFDPAKVTSDDQSVGLAQ